MKKLKIGITGVSGFVGSHLRDRLSREQTCTVLPYDDSYYDNPPLFIDFCRQADVIVHLAGVNRDEPEVVYQKNIELMDKLLRFVDAAGGTPYILFSSSTQIERDNEYGRGKKRAMELLESWANRRKASAVSMVIPNVFGDGGRPFYNSVVATFCYQLTHNQEPTILKDGTLKLIYINDLVEDIFSLIQNPPDGYRIEYIRPRVETTVSQILAHLKRFQKAFYETGTVPSLESAFERDLYATFLTYMEAPEWKRSLKRNADERGVFVEVYKMEKGGQVSFSTTKPGVTRGNHYHIRKSEKFCVVSGQASIKLRRIGTDRVIEYRVSGEEPCWIEMPIYYTHSITNIGTSDLLTLFWISEPFDPNDPDTFYEKVEP